MQSESQHKDLLIEEITSLRTELKAQLDYQQELLNYNDNYDNSSSNNIRSNNNTKINISNQNKYDEEDERKYHNIRIDNYIYNNTNQQQPQQQQLQTTTASDTTANRDYNDMNRHNLQHKHSELTPTFEELTMEKEEVEVESDSWSITNLLLFQNSSSNNNNHHHHDSNAMNVVLDDNDDVDVDDNNGRKADLPSSSSSSVLEFNHFQLIGMMNSFIDAMNKGIYLATLTNAPLVTKKSSSSSSLVSSSSTTYHSKSIISHTQQQQQQQHDHYDNHIDDNKRYQHSINHKILSCLLETIISYHDDSHHPHNNKQTLTTIFPTLENNSIMSTEELSTCHEPSIQGND